MDIIAKAKNGLLLLSALGAGLMLFCIFGIIFVNAVMRYTVGISLEMGEELPVYLTIYGVMFGMTYAYLQDLHINFTVVVHVLPDSFKKTLEVFIDLSIAVIGFCLCYSGWLLMMKRGKIEASGIISSMKDLVETTGATFFISFGHMGFWYFSFVMGGAILGIAGLLKAIGKATGQAGLDESQLEENQAGV